MNANFWIIFLSLLIGCVIGFEVGKHTATKKIQEFLNKIGEDLQKAAQKQKEDQEQKKKEAEEALKNLEKIFAMMKETRSITEEQQKANSVRCVQNSIYGTTMAKRSAVGDTDGNVLFKDPHGDPQFAIDAIEKSNQTDGGDEA